MLTGSLHTALTISAQVLDKTIVDIVCPKLSSDASGTLSPTQNRMFASSTDERVDNLRSENTTTTRIVKEALDMVVSAQKAQSSQDDPTEWLYWF
jgi:hypothetical protein